MTCIRRRLETGLWPFVSGRCSGSAKGSLIVERFAICVLFESTHPTPVVILWIQDHLGEAGSWDPRSSHITPSHTQRQQSIHHASREIHIVATPTYSCIDRLRRRESFPCFSSRQTQSAIVDLPGWNRSELE